MSGPDVRPTDAQSPLESPVTTCSRPRHPAPSRAVLALATGAATAALAFTGAPAAHAAPGDNGDIKVHESTTPVTDQRDEPQVCRFYLDAFNFDTLQLVSWTIEQQPPTGTQQVAAGALALVNGTGRTPDMTLPNGHYRVNWTFAGETGSAKHKVFIVDCGPGGGPTDIANPSPSASPSPSAGTSTSPRPSTSPSPGGPPPGGGNGGHGGGPHGGVGTGGGGTSQGLNATEVGAGSALLALAAGLGIRAARRRATRNAAA